VPGDSAEPGPSPRDQPPGISKPSPEPAGPDPLSDASARSPDPARRSSISRTDRGGGGGASGREHPAPVRSPVHAASPSASSSPASSSSSASTAAAAAPTLREPLREGPRDWKDEGQLRGLKESLGAGGRLQEMVAAQGDALREWEVRKKEMDRKKYVSVPFAAAGKGWGSEEGVDGCDTVPEGTLPADAASAGAASRRPAQAQRPEQQAAYARHEAAGEEAAANMRRYLQQYCRGAAGTLEQSCKPPASLSPPGKVVHVGWAPGEVEVKYFISTSRHLCDYVS
jgi:hypothetical protein